MSHFVTCKIKWDHCVYGNAWSKALLPEAAVKVEMLKTVAVLLLLLPLLLLLWWLLLLLWLLLLYQGADKSLARPGRKQTWKHVRDTWIFNNIETQAVIKFLLLQGKTPKEIHDILTETLACFLPGRAKDLTAPLYKNISRCTVLWMSKPLMLCTSFLREKRKNKIKMGTKTWGQTELNNVQLYNL